MELYSPNERQTMDDELEEDWVLRAPLRRRRRQPGQDNDSSSVSVAATTAAAAADPHDWYDHPSIQQQQHDAFVRPMVSALCIGAHVLQVSVETRFTTAVLLHRYYYYNYDNDIKNNTNTSTRLDDVNDKEEMKYVVAACLWLAGKREEEPRRVRDLVNFVCMIDWNTTPQPPQTQRSNTNENENNTSKEEDATKQDVMVWRSHPPPLMSNTNNDNTNDSQYYFNNFSFDRAKDRLIQTEQCDVLPRLSYDVAVSHPHRVVVVLLQSLLLENTTNKTELGGGGRVSLEERMPLMLDDDPQQQQQQQYHHSSSAATAANDVDFSTWPLLWASFAYLNAAIYSCEALHHGVLPLGVASLVLAATQPHDKNDHWDAVPTPNSIEEWCSRVPVTTAAHVEAAMQSLRQLPER